MRAHFTFWLVCLLAAAHLSAADPAPLEIKIDPAVQHGVWEGWGTSLCWMGKVFGQRDDVADFLFTTRTVRFNGESVPGLGLNIARYNAGACSWNVVDGRKMAVSRIIKSYRQIEGFWLDGKDPDPQSASWDWNADAGQRALLLKARERGASHFELFSNSPMWWMCANDNPSGAAQGSQDNLSAKNYPAFATYLATVDRVARDRWGIAFESVEPFNEPTTTYWSADCKQEGCHFSRSAQASFLPLLRAELDRQGLQSTIIAASDETNYSAAVDTWKSFDPQLRALISRVNVHGYQYDHGPRAELHHLIVQESGKKLWNSEYGKGDRSGFELARNLHRDFAQLHPTAWSYWQPTDGGGWGLLDCDMEKGEIRAPEIGAWVLAQYTRHIRPGMIILGCSDAHTIAAYDAKTHRLVLVILNDGPARPITFDLSAFAVPDQQVESILTELHGPARYLPQKDQAIRQSRLSVLFPADAVITFEVPNASLAAP